MFYKSSKPNRAIGGRIVVFQLRFETATAFMRKKTRGWSYFNTGQKLEALRTDVNIALDLTEELKDSLKQTNAELGRLARHVFELTRNK